MQAINLMRPPDHGYLAPFNHKYGMMTMLLSQKTNLVSEIQNGEVILELEDACQFLNAAIFRYRPSWQFRKLMIYCDFIQRMSPAWQTVHFKPAGKAIEFLSCLYWYHICKKQETVSAIY